MDFLFLYVMLPFALASFNQSFDQVHHNYPEEEVPSDSPDERDKYAYVEDDHEEEYVATTNAVSPNTTFPQDIEPPGTGLWCRIESLLVDFGILKGPVRSSFARRFKLPGLSIIEDYGCLYQLACQNPSEAYIVSYKAHIVSEQMKILWLTARLLPKDIDVVIAGLREAVHQGLTASACKQYNCGGRAR